MKLRVAAIVSVGLALVAFGWLVRQLSFGSLGMAANDEVRTQLRASLDDQKKLARLDPERRGAYRERFDGIGRLLVHLGVLDHSRARLTRQIEVALVAAFGAILAAAIAAAVAAQRRRDRQRLRSLEHLAAWQEAARRHAHEIRTPLTAAQMEVDRLVSLVARKLPSEAEEVEQARTSIREELERLRAFTKSFTSFATIAEPHLARHDLAVLVEEFCAAFANAWSGLRLDVEPPAERRHPAGRSAGFQPARSREEPRPPGRRRSGRLEAGAPQYCVLADRALLRQVLVNLCNNSALANAAAVRFSLRRDAARVHLDVADDGAGIDPAVRRRIFEPYTTTRPVGEGMGLGLAISKKILLDHGGDLTLLDTARGAAFRLTFAAAPTEASA